MPIRNQRAFLPLRERDPLRVMFLINDMTVGGAEMLLFNLIQRLDRRRFAPELGCMSKFGELGEELAGEVPSFKYLIKHKYDLPVVFRLKRLMRDRQIDALVTVGAGDRMFWGRLAAWRARVPVVICAIHSTGWPDRIERLNRMLTPLTDAFVGVAGAHARYLIDVERFPADRVHVIPNGVDTDRFRPQPKDPAFLRECGVPAGALVVGIVAQLRPEKNHELLLHAASKIRQQRANAHFLIVGDGERRSVLESRTDQLGLRDCVHFLGARRDVPRLLPNFDLFALTSKMEANPVSILEAQACGVPVVATRVGSICDSVLDGETGVMVPPEDAYRLADALSLLLSDDKRRAKMGIAARQNVELNWSLERMVHGYEDLIERIYAKKVGRYNRPAA
jgi:glycosyltransferase involved in cell wall biosynthesis